MLMSYYQYIANECHAMSVQSVTARHYGGIYSMPWPSQLSANAIDDLLHTHCGSIETIVSTPLHSYITQHGYPYKYEM